MTPVRLSQAFTLIELLTVMGILTLMAGILGLALREGSPATALESAQATVVSLLAAARGQVALNQNRAMLVVDADPAGDHFLRGVHVAVETAPNSGRWWLAGDGMVLARGAYFVPGSAGVDGAVFSAGDASTPPWPDGRRSSLGWLSMGSIAPSEDNSSGKYLGMIGPLTASGTGGGDKLVIAIARRTPAGVVFERPEQVRGVALSSYGVAILINDGPGFDF